MILKIQTHVHFDLDGVPTRVFGWRYVSGFNDIKVTQMLKPRIDEENQLTSGNFRIIDEVEPEVWKELFQSLQETTDKHEEMPYINRITLYDDSGYVSGEVYCMGHAYLLANDGKTIERV